MARTRTTPAAIATAHVDVINQFGIEIAYNENHDAVPTKSVFFYRYVNLGASGEPLRQDYERIVWGDLPNAARTALKTLYSLILTDAQNKGHIGAGTDSGDLT